MFFFDISLLYDKKVKATLIISIRTIATTYL